MDRSGGSPGTTVPYIPSVAGVGRPTQSALVRDAYAYRLWDGGTGSGDHVVEGLNDVVVKSGKHLLQMTTCHDEFSERSIVRLA
jgi:hypothetical protein